MGTPEIVEFASNGSTGQGYLATPESPGPAVVVIQEWWGLVDHIKDVCERFAAEGFVAVAPDLYRGESASEPDEAGKLMMAMNFQRAGQDMGGAVDFLLGRDDVTSSGVGVVGYCMGGGLALVLGTQRPEQVKAVAPYYGVIPWPDAQPDWSAMAAPVQGHYAENDAFANPESVRALEQTLKSNGVDAEMFIYDGTEHAFFNDARPDVYDAAASTQAWSRTLDFFRSKLG